MWPNLRKSMKKLWSGSWAIGKQNVCYSQVTCGSPSRKTRGSPLRKTRGRIRRTKVKFEWTVTSWALSWNEPIGHKYSRPIITPASLRPSTDLSVKMLVGPPSRNVDFDNTCRTSFRKCRLWRIGKAVRIREYQERLKTLLLLELAGLLQKQKIIAKQDRIYRS